MKADVRSDVLEAVSTGDYGRKYKTREDLIRILETKYPDLSKDEIAAEVYGAIPDQAGQTTSGTSFWSRLFSF